MARISQQTKDGLTIILTTGVGLSTGFFVDAWIKRENFSVSLASLVAFCLVQLVLAFVPSQDMADLEEYRKGEMADLRISNAYAAQALKLAEEGNLSEAMEWQKASVGRTTGRKTR